MSSSELHANIRARMEELGITQTALAQRIGVTPAAISRYANGERVPNALILARIAAELHLTMEQLTGTPPPADNHDIDDAVRLVARSSRELSVAQKQLLISALLGLGDTQ